MTNESFIDAKTFRRLRHIPGQPLTYVQNPKVATKSIELSLWKAFDPNTAPRNPHAQKITPFLRANNLDARSIESLGDSEFFSVVRNPYSRFLSGYLNKVGRRGPWRNKTSRRFGVEGTHAPSIEEFLEIVKGAEVHSMDPHFRPQHINLLHGPVSLDFVGYFEEMDAVRQYLLGHGIMLVNNTLNSTGVSMNRVAEMLSPRAIELIQDIYHLDFEIYGYSKDPQKASAVSPIRSMARNREALERYLEANS